MSPNKDESVNSDQNKKSKDRLPHFDAFKETNIEDTEALQISEMIDEGAPTHEPEVGLESDHENLPELDDEDNEEAEETIDTPMGLMTVYEVLFYHDGPKQFITRDNKGDYWIATMVEEDEKNHTEFFLWAKVSVERLNSILKGEAPLRDAYTHAESNEARVVAFTFTDDGIVTSEDSIIATEDLTDDLLPSEDSYLSNLSHRVVSSGETRDKASLNKEEVIEKDSQGNLDDDSGPMTGWVPVIDENESDSKKTKNKVESLPEIESEPSSSEESDKEKEPTSSLTADNKASSGSPAVEKSNKKSGKVAKAVTFSALGLALLGAAGFYFYPQIADNTTVPQASQTVPMGNEITTACDDFIAASLKCNAEAVPSDLAERGTLLSQSIESGEKVKKDSEIVLKYSSGPASSEFPNLTNKTVDEARDTLYNLNISVKEIKEVAGSGVEKDRVVSTSIKPGDKIESGAEVILEVSSGKVKVPNWVDKTQEYVEADAKKLGIDVEFKTEESDKASGVVISQSPKGDEISNDSKVQVTVSKSFESKAIKVPDVIGKSAEDAQLDLATAGFRHIKTVSVKNSEVTEKQVTQTVPGAGQNGKSEENIVIIVSEPDSK